MLILDRIAHAPEVDWNMRCVGHQLAVWAKDGTREVQPLLDVQRDASLLKRPSHLLCYPHKPVPKDTELDRVDNQLAATSVSRSLLDQVDDNVRREHLGLCSGHDYDCLSVIDDDGRAGYHVPRLQVVETEYFGLLAPAICEIDFFLQGLSCLICSARIAWILTIILTFFD